MRATASYLSISKSCSLSAKDKLLYPQVKPTSVSEELQRVWSVWDLWVERRRRSSGTRLHCCNMSQWLLTSHDSEM